METRRQRNRHCCGSPPMETPGLAIGHPLCSTTDVAAGVLQWRLTHGVTDIVTGVLQHSSRVTVETLRQGDRCCCRSPPTQQSSDCGDSWIGGRPSIVQRDICCRRSPSTQQSSDCGDSWIGSGPSITQRCRHCHGRLLDWQEAIHQIRQHMLHSATNTAR